MRLRISRRTKRSLANRVGNNYFLRLLIFSVPFRLAIAGFIGLMILLGLLLPRIWTASPAGFLPVVKLSGLDWAQAWSLKRRARQQMVARQFAEAHDTWLMAVENNPADPQALRGLLTNSLANPTLEADSTTVLIHHSLWLLRLTQTNDTDAALAAALFEKCDHDELARDVLAPKAGRLTATEQAIYLKALFRLRQTNDFAAAWQQFQAARLPDPELPAYGAASAAGWGTPQEAAEGRQRLETLARDPRLRVLANRLQLQVSAEKRDLAWFQRSFQQLRDWREDQLLDHTRYWVLLAQSGRLAEAKQLAEKNTASPATAAELIGLTDAYRALGLPELALPDFTRLARQFQDSDLVWVKFAEFLEETGNWDELMRLAFQVRTENQDRLAGFGYFLEGYAEHAMERRPAAEAAFGKMNQVWAGRPVLARAAYSQLLKLGYTNYAAGLADRVQMGR